MQNLLNKYVFWPQHSKSVPFFSVPFFFSGASFQRGEGKAVVASWLMSLYLQKKNQFEKKKGERRRLVLASWLMSLYLQKKINLKKKKGRGEG